MPDKKLDPAAHTEQTELERRVDAIMSVEPQPTAPLLPAALLKGVDTDKIKSAKHKIQKPAPPPEEPEPPEPDEALPDGTDPEPPTTATIADSSLLEDGETDEAVDDIVAHEADTQLAVDDALARHRTAEAESLGGRPSLLTAFFTSPWTWLFIIGTVSVLYIWYR